MLACRLITTNQAERRGFGIASSVSAPIADKLREEIASAFGPDWLARGLDGLPNYVDVPGEVNVQEILRLWTYAKSLDLIEWGRMRYNLLNGAGGHWFPGRSAAEFDDSAVLSTLGGHPFASRIPGYLREAHAALLDVPKKRLSQGGD
jgi:predicted aldo/keto reductase-like oxidoreductase